MPAIDTQRGKPSRPRRATRRTPPRPAPADTKGASEFARAERYKRTPRYRRQVQQTYSEQSPQRKAQIRRATAGRRDLTSRAIQQRALRESREVRDVKGAADMRRGRAQSQANIRQARIDYLRRTRNSIDPGDVVRGALVVMTSGAGRKHKGKRGLPGASADAVTLSVPTVAGSITRGAEGTARATLRNPKGVAAGTAKGLRDALTGIPSTVAKTAVETVEGTKAGDPLRGIKGALADYAKDLNRRYGGLSKPGGVERFAKRVEKEGVAGELLDLATLGSGVGGAVGRAAGTTARQGGLGPRAQRVASEPRRARRSTGGTTREAALSPNLVAAVGQKAVDARRAKRQGRKVARAQRRGVPVDAVLAEAVARGEIAQKRSGLRSAAGVQVAREKGRAVVSLKREQATEVDRGARKQIGSLSRDERLAFKYATQLGATTPKAARAALTKRRAAIVAEREAKGVAVPRVRRKTNDELRAIDHLLKDVEGAFTPKLARVVKGERRREVRVAKGDPGLDPVQAQLRRYLPQAEHLGIKRAEGESDARFLRRVVVAGERAGLRRPGYFPSEKRPTGVFGSRAVGGTKAVVEDKAYTGALFRSGRESVDPEVFERGLARGIKRKHNWNLVARQFDENTFEWGRNKTIGELADEIDRRGIDPDSVAFWNPRKYREHRQVAESSDADVERTGRGEEPSGQGIDKAVEQSAFTREQLATLPEEFRNTRGWSVVPKAVHSEIHAETRPSGPVARSIDVVKGKQSRVLLGLSPSWLQFQVASNALLTGLSGTGPSSVAKAQLWWRKLSDEEKAAVEPYIGVGNFRVDTQQTKLGAAASNRVVDAYRAFKATPFMQRIGRGNPLDLLFRADEAQNNVFRRAVLYNSVKREAYKRMGQDAKALAGLQTRITDIMRLGPDEQMRAILRDHRALERHAQRVNDFLGDYTTYTAKERRYLQRNVMFYGFLRFSLRFTFYTLPVKHPLMTSILAQFGKLQTEEVRKLLGGDELPWALGKLFFDKDGKLHSIDLSRANPVSNALSDMRGPKDLAGFLPPLAIAIADQVYGKGSFRGREFRVEGENQPRKYVPYGAENRARIFLDQMLNLAAPYRHLEKATQAGPQGDDSLLFSPRPTRYKDPKILRSLREQEAQRPQGVMDRLKPELFPLTTPRPDTAPEQAESVRENREEEQKRIDKGKRRPSLGSARSGMDDTDLEEARQAIREARSAVDDVDRDEIRDLIRSMNR